MERGIEDCDVRNARKEPSRIGDCFNRRLVVQRRELDKDTEPLFDLVVDPRRLAQLTPVDDAMRDGVDLCRNGGERVDGCCVTVGVDEVQLQARRARVDDEDVQPGQVQSRIAGGSSPCSRPYARARRRLSTMS